MRSFLQKHIQRNDEAISPVIGTILMVAATVIIGGAVYAAVNAYSGKAAKPAIDAAFKAQALDTDNDGLEDTLKITYLAGPTGASPSLKIADSTGAAVPAAAAHTGTWSPGDFATFATTGDVAATIFVTVSLGENTVLDQTLALKE